MNRAWPSLEPLRRLARAIPGGMALGRWLRRLIDPEMRAIHRLIRTERERLLQPFPDTFEERYPALFDVLANRLADLSSPRILSFGCSSGAEVRSLRRRMPDARITGIDLNPRALAKARRADPHRLSSYRRAAGPDPADQFDAILALAVFRHGALETERPDDCSAIFPFARFESAVAALDASLVPGGWLAIANSHFRFSDTTTGKRYDTAALDLPEVRSAGLIYGPQGRRLPDGELLPVLFRKP